jgi:hypothetical protein
MKRIRPFRRRTAWSMSSVPTSCGERSALCSWRMRRSVAVRPGKPAPSAMGLLGVLSCCVVEKLLNFLA